MCVWRLGWLSSEGFEMLRIGYVNVTHSKDPKEEARCHSPGGLAVLATTPTVVGRDSAPDVTNLTLATLHSHVLNKPTMSVRVQ